MDPNATLRLILSTLLTLKADDNPSARAEAIEHLRHLADWLERGGFPPQVSYTERQNES